MPTIAEIADATLDKVSPDADVDVMAELAPLLPIKVIAAMLGVPGGGNVSLTVFAAVSSEDFGGWKSVDPRLLGLGAVLG